MAKICRKTWIFIHYASLHWVNTFQHRCYRVSAICRFIYISIAATNVNTILQIFTGAMCAKQTIDRDTTSSRMAENKRPPPLNIWYKLVCTKQSIYVYIICALCNVNIPIFLVPNAFFFVILTKIQLENTYKSKFVHNSPLLSFYSFSQFFIYFCYLKFSILRYQFRSGVYI